MTVFAVAPSVQYSERDATLFTKASYNVAAAFAGVSRWGKVGEPIHVTGGEQDFKDKVFQPNDATYLDYFMAIDYARYSDEFMFLRMCGATARNAVNTGANAVRVDTKDDFESTSFVNDVTFVGRYPGTLGNSITVHTIDGAGFDTSEFNDFLTYRPQEGEFTIVLVDNTGEITGGGGQVNQVDQVTLTGLVGAQADTLVLGGVNVTIPANTNAGVDSAALITAIDDVAEYGNTTLVNAVPDTHKVVSVSIGGVQEANDANFVLLGVAASVAINDTPAQVATKVKAAYDTAASTAVFSSFEIDPDDDTRIIAVNAVRGDVAVQAHTQVGGSTLTLTDTVDIPFADGFSVLHYTHTAIGLQDTATSSATDLTTLSASVVTGSLGTIIPTEVYELVQDVAGAKNSMGGNAYFYDVLKNGSNYIYSAIRNGLAVGDVVMAGGVDDYNIDRTSGYDEFSNSELYDVSMIVGVGTIGEQQSAVDASITRRDCVTFLSPPIDSVVGARGNERSNVVAWRNEQLLRDSSYMFMDDQWAVVWDEYNSTERWIPAAGGTAGLYARAIALEGPWKSPAFLNRGKYKGYRRMAWRPGPTDRKELYKNQINSIVTRKEGIVLWGDKTGLSRPSAFGHLNVRGTFIMVEKNIATMAEYFLGENNDAFTRAMFTNTVRPYIRDLEGRNAILEGKVKCDETNNTGQIIATNQMVAGIWIKPQYSINWIFLDFAALRPDMSFDEIENGGGIVAAG